MTVFSFDIPTLFLGNSDRVLDRNTFTMLFWNMIAFLNWYSFGDRMAFFLWLFIALFDWF